MNPIALLLQIGKIIQAFKDVEKGIADLIHKNYSPSDLKAVLEDIKAIVDSGLISIPGISAAEIDAAITGLESTL